MNDSKAWLRRLMLPLCALLLLVVMWLIPPIEKPQRLRIAPSLWPGAEALVLAHTQQLLPTGRFQMIELPWPSAVMRALGNDAADVAVVTLDNVLRMREAGQPLRVLLVLDESVGADAVMAQPEISEVQALRGKRIGVDARDVGIYLLVNALESADMTLQDVQVVPMIQPEMKDAMHSRTVDAVVVAEPWLTRLRLDGLQRVYDSSQLQTPILRLVVASEQSWRSARSELAMLLQVESQMNKQMRSGASAELMQPILRREKLTAKEFAACLERVRPLGTEENATMLAGANPKLAQLAAEIEEQMIRNGLLSHRPKTGDWIDPTLFREAWR